jgi:hypothetical protein
MCSTPVTFGGGIMITKGSPRGSSGGRKAPDASQRS